MPALLSEVFKHNNYSLYNGTIQKQENKCDEIIKHFENCKDCQQRVIKILQDKDNLKTQLQELKQENENLSQRINQIAGSKNFLLNIIPEDSNPIVVAIIALIIVDLLTKFFKN